ncbi:type II secretion system protein G precursor [mine drainage metagenome]|uniref:Type II secretion system protein G n=1 Tax=mine drainage metagenome TaxID=410659 RepID=A0A1J5TRI5_9ZZZZ
MTAVRRKGQGFTLIELIVVMLIIAMLATLAVPRYFGSVQKSRDAVLKENLALMRGALDKYYGDNDKYPAALEDLVSHKYLRSIPPDPLTDSAKTWVTVPPDDPDKGGVYDVHSGAEGNAADGTAYKEW